MSERKVLNKYYPKDYDPSKIPKNRQEKNRQWNIRIMAPFNMRCNTCGEYIYKGKKFNSRKEDVEDETYLGLKIFRFYIRCPRCVAEIAFRTDPENTDYSLEAGATRNFEALRTAEMLAEKERQAKEEEDKNNPMKVLENRTKASQREMEMLETLEELRELNSRQAIIDHEKMIKLHAAYEEQLGKLQDEEDEAFIKSLFGKKGEESVKRLKDDEDDDDKEKKNGDNKTDEPPTKKLATGLPPTSVLTEEKSASAGIRKTAQKPQVWEKSIGSLSNKNSLKMLVKKKPLVNPTSDTKSQPAVHPTSNPEVEGNSNSDEDRCKPKNHSTSTGLRNNTNSDTAPKATSAAPEKTGALGLLGNYSDSDASSEGDNE